jgi:hypothetical protein
MIAALQQFPPDMRVLVDGYEMGYDDPKPLERIVAVQISESRSYIGMYEEDSWAGSTEDGPRFDAVVIPR